MACVALITAVAGGGFALLHSQRLDDRAGHAQPDDRVLRLSEVSLKQGREVLQVRGPDPSAVLAAYSFHAASIHGLRPVDLQIAAPPAAGVRVGILEDPALGRWEVEIRRMSASEWVIGDGEAPIRPRAASKSRGPGYGPKQPLP